MKTVDITPEYREAYGRLADRTIDTLWGQTIPETVTFDPMEFVTDYDMADEFYWNPVEQGMYDDDPNPYHGTYSEE